VVAKQQYFDDLNALLGAMTPGTIDMCQIEANERHHSHRFFDPPETVRTWLLDQQRRVQARWPRGERACKDRVASPQHASRSTGSGDMGTD